MKNALICIVVILSILGSVCGCSSSQDELARVVKRTKGTVAFIATYNCVDTLIGQGTGFFVSHNQLITNEHVLKVACRAEVRLPSGKVYSIVRVIGYSDSADVVRVEVDTRGDKVNYLQLAKSPANEGERIIIVGNPLGLQGSISEGIVSSIREIAPYGQVIQMTAPISPGSSGSPVMNTDAEVVGIATMYLKEGQSLNFAIPIAALHNLKQIEKNEFSDWTLHYRHEEFRKYQDLVSNGTKHYDAKDYSLALSYFLQLAEFQNDNWLPYMYIPRCYEALGRYVDALDAYQYALRRWPEQDINHYQLGLLYLRFDREQDAIRIYRILKKGGLKGSLIRIEDGENFYVRELRREIRNWQLVNNKPMLQ
jgi:hypothetical protein